MSTQTTHRPTRATGRRRHVVFGSLGVAGAAAALGLAAAPAQAAETGVPVLEAIKECESGGDYAAVNAGSGAAGAYQFLDSTWQSLSSTEGYASAAAAPEAVQDAAAIELYTIAGTDPWSPSQSCWAGAASAGPVSDTVLAEAVTATSSAEASAEETFAAETPAEETSVTEPAVVRESAPTAEAEQTVEAEPAQTAEEQGTSPAAGPADTARDAAPVASVTAPAAGEPAQAVEAEAENARDRAQTDRRC